MAVAGDVLALPPIAPAALIELIDNSLKKTAVGANTFEIRRSPQFDALLNPMLE